MPQNLFALRLEFERFMKINYGAFVAFSKTLKYKMAGYSFSINQNDAKHICGLFSVYCAN